MLPDGRLIPWHSPRGTPLRIAAAAPVIPWTDLVYAIAPNGRTLTYAVTPPGAGVNPVGVFKASFANGIFAAAQFATGPGQPTGEPFVPGRPMGYLAPAGSDPDADVANWVARADQGEPYDDARAHAIVDTLERYHAPYYVDSSEPPAPLLLAAGFTDDLFPVDAAQLPEGAGLAPARRLRPSARLEQAGDARGAACRHPPLDGPLPPRRPAAADRRERVDADLPARRPARRAVHRTDLHGPRPGGGPLRLEHAADDRLERRRPANGRRARPRRGRRRRLRHHGHGTRVRHRRVLAPGGARRRLHAAGRPDDCRAPPRDRRSRRGPDRRTAVGRRPRRRVADPRRPRSLPPERRNPGMAAPPGRLAVRTRPRAEARAARQGPAVRAAVERRLPGRGPEPPAPPARSRAARLPRHASAGRAGPTGRPAPCSRGD